MALLAIRLRNSGKNSNSKLFVAFSRGQGQRQKNDPNPGTHNESFEIQAFENAQVPSGSPTMPNWPQAPNHSNIVTVARK
jgi:hypothetical protein